MLVEGLREIGNALYRIRKNRGLTQTEVAEIADLSDRTYADIERGGVNMRLETLLKICRALNITPNDILTVECPRKLTEADIVDIMSDCTEYEKETALKLLGVYLDSLKR